MNTFTIERKIASHFGVRQSLIVPNVSWGFHLHECDLLIVSKSNYLTEVEIKTSRADLVRDKHKRHGHRSNRIRRLFFAIPRDLEKDIEHIPERAGILAVEKKTTPSNGWYFQVHQLRKPEINKSARPITSEERSKIAHLGCMRLWSMRTSLANIKDEIKILKKIDNRAKSADEILKMFMNYKKTLKMNGYEYKDQIWHYGRQHPFFTDDIEKIIKRFRSKKS